MREFQIRLRSVQDVQEFVALATAVPFPVRVGSDKYRAMVRASWKCSAWIWPIP